MEKWFVSYETEKELIIVIVQAKNKREAMEIVAKERKEAQNIICMGKQK